MLNKTKCELTCFSLEDLHDERDIAALQQFRHEDNGLVINDRSLRLLGCVVGRDSASIAERMAADDHFRVNQLAAFRRLKLIKKQTGMLALRRLSGAVIHNRLRAMPPAAVIEHAQQYDQQETAAARTLVGVTAAQGNRYDEQLQQPLLHGRALDSRQRRCWRLPHTSLAQRSRCGTLQFSPRSGRAKPELDPSCFMYAGINDCLSRVTALESSLQSRLDRALPDVPVPASVLPRTASEFVAHFRAQPPCSIQHSATHRINTQIFNARMAEAVAARRVEDAARLASLRLARHSSLWLQTLPVEPSLALGDLQWQWAARLRLGMDVPVVDDACPACKSTTAYTDNSWHALSCVALSGI